MKAADLTICTQLDFVHLSDITGSDNQVLIIKCCRKAKEILILSAFWQTIEKINGGFCYNTACEDFYRTHYPFA